MRLYVPEVETARLRLRAFEPGDFEALAAIRADPEVMRFIGAGEPQTREGVRTWLANNELRWQRFGFGMWAVALRDGGRLAGWCGLSMLDSTPETEVGYGAAREFWGRGIATEAACASLRYGFEEKALERIVAVAVPENTASRRVMEKLGMKYERHARYYGNVVAYYAVGRAEFEPAAGPYYLHAPGGATLAGEGGAAP